jgi:LuxR family maltose regulon positive regulatory protein
LAETIGLQSPNLIGFAHTAVTLIQARAKLAAERGDEALNLLAPCVQALEASQQGSAAVSSALVEALALRALAHRKLGQLDLAREDIQRALDLAAPEGYARVFLDEGEAMRLLMADCRGMIEKQARQGEAESTRALSYIDRLLLAYPTSAPQASHIESEISNQKSDILTDPLTERELQVLRLMAEGWPNAEIAARLVVAESTVKKHVNHIFDKLGAQTRVQALVKARELGLL